MMKEYQNSRNIRKQHLMNETLNGTWWNQIHSITIHISEAKGTTLPERERINMFKEYDRFN